MVKKIGNCLIFFLLVGSYLVRASELQLRVLTMKGKPISSLEVGTPYMLEIKAEGAQDLYKVKVAGMEHCYYEFRGASHMDLMSHITTVHNYLIRFDKEGTFTLGPALLAHQQGITQSNSIQLQVSPTKKSSQVTIELLVPQQRVVAHETIPAKLFVTVAQEGQLIDVKIPPFDPALVEFSALDKPIQNSFTQDGVTYKTYEWPLQVTVKKEGELIIPSWGALCRIPIQNQRNTLFGFSFNMYGSHDQWFQSQPVSLTVDQLPCDFNDLDGIGIFERCSQSIDHKQAQIGEGIVLRLIVEGKDGVVTSKAPRLNLGQAFKYYESKASVEKKGDHYKKTFEYIVQASKAGDLEIPAQRYSFFDTRSRTVKKLSTQPLSITIVPDIVLTPKDNNDTIQDQLDDSAMRDDASIFPIEQNYGWNPVSQRSMSIFLFFVIISFSIMGTCCIYAFLYWSNTTRKQKKYLFRFMKKKLATLKQEGDATDLYALFIQLFAERYKIANSAMNADSIQDILKKAGFVSSTIDQWNRFFNQLSEYAFFKSSLDAQSMHDIFNRASLWINQLEERL